MKSMLSKDTLLEAFDRIRLNARDLPSRAYAYTRYTVLLRDCGAEPEDVIASALVAASMMALLTPNEVLTAFPPSKVYYGAQLGCKDYFSTMDAVRTYPHDELIGTLNIFDFLLEYNNVHINSFMIALILAISDKKKRETGIGIIDEWIEEHGVRGVMRYEDDEGRGYFFDPTTGKTHRERTKAPWKYKVIRGGKR